jgi:hypothetical protein
MYCVGCRRLSGRPKRSRAVGRTELISIDFRKNSLGRARLCRLLPPGLVEGGPGPIKIMRFTGLISDPTRRVWHLAPCGIGGRSVLTKVSPPTSNGRFSSPEFVMAGVIAPPRPLLKKAARVFAVDCLGYSSSLPNSRLKESSSMFAHTPEMQSAARRGAK